MLKGLVRQYLRGAWRRRVTRRALERCGARRLAVPRCRLFRRGLLIQGPLLEIVRRSHIHDDGHEAMIAAAQRGALSPVNAFLARVDPEPQFIDESRYGGALGAEIRDPPRVDHVL